MKKLLLLSLLAYPITSFGMMTELKDSALMIGSVAAGTMAYSIAHNIAANRVYQYPHIYKASKKSVIYQGVRDGISYWRGALMASALLTTAAKAPLGSCEKFNLEDLAKPAAIVIGITAASATAAGIFGYYFYKTHPNACPADRWHREITQRHELSKQNSPAFHARLLSGITTLISGTLSIGTLAAYILKKRLS